MRRHFALHSSSSGDTCRKNSRWCCVIVHDGKKGESLKKWLESHFIYYHDRCKNATTLDICHKALAQSRRRHMRICNCVIYYTESVFSGGFIWHRTCSTACKYAHTACVYYVRLIVSYWQITTDKNNNEIRTMRPNTRHIAHSCCNNTHKHKREKNTRIQVTPIDSCSALNVWMCYNDNAIDLTNLSSPSVSLPLHACQPVSYRNFMHSILFRI